jgi:hypothetical protein
MVHSLTNMPGGWSVVSDDFIQLDAQHAALTRAQHELEQSLAVLGGVTCSVWRSPAQRACFECVEGVRHDLRAVDAEILAAIDHVRSVRSVVP